MPLNQPIQKRYHSITEVAKALSVNASQLRYWEKEFRQLNPRTNARGKRFYTEKDIELIRQIHELVKVQGYTINGARKVMNAGHEAVKQALGHSVTQVEESASAVAVSPSSINPELRVDVINRLKQIRLALQELEKEVD